MPNGYASDGRRNSRRSAARCCRRFRSRGLTLVEVVAGLVLLGTLLASVLVGFAPEEREYYKLERLWGDAPVVVHVQ